MYGVCDEPVLGDYPGKLKRNHAYAGEEGALDSQIVSVWGSS